MKKCSKCNETKDIDEFNKYSRNVATGLRADCKKCQGKQTVIDSENRRNKKLNQQKFDQIHRGLSAQATKVYDAIPISDSWSITQIMQELHRLNISMSDARVVGGCLNSLIDCGLVVEAPKRMFRREVIRPKFERTEAAPEVIATTKEIEMKQTAHLPSKTAPYASAIAIMSPLDRLSSFASRLRDLATEMENAAIDLAGQAEKNEAETAKMRQLQALLKSLG